MSVEKRGSGELPVIVVCGEVDRVNVDEFRDSVAERLASGERRVLLDFERCSFVDSSVLSVLLTAVRDVGERGLVGVIAPPATVARVFSLVGLLSIPTFHVFETLAAATAYLAALD